MRYFQFSISKFFSLIFICLFTFLSVNIFAQDEEIPITTNSDEARQLFLDGRDYFENIEMNAALDNFNKAIQVDPEFAMAYLMRAQVIGDFNKAHSDINKAISLKNNVSEGEKHLIEMFNAQLEGKSKVQEEHLSKLLEMYPSDKRVQALAGTYYYVNQEYDKALNHYNKSVEADENYAPAYNMIGYTKAALEDLSGAEDAFKNYISLVPESPNPYDSYAELLLKEGKHDESIKYYTQALEKDPEFATAYAGIGNNYIFKGDFNAARENYQKYFDNALTVNGKLNAVYLKAVSYCHEKEPLKAVSTFDEYRDIAQKANLVGKEIMSHGYQGFILTETGKPEDGMQHYKMAMELTNNSNLPEPVKDYYKTYSMMWQTHALLADNKLDDAKTELDKCNEMVINRNNPDEQKFLHSLYAMMEMKNGNHDKALEHFSKAEQNNPTNIYYMAVVHEMKGDNESALALYNKIYNMKDNDINLSLFRSKAYDKVNGVK